MKGHRKLLLISCFFIIDILLVIGIVFICRNTLNNVLVKEVNSLVSFDVTSDRYDLDIKMYGNYGKVEEAIKCYLDNYALELQAVLSSIDYDKLDTFVNERYYLNDISIFNDDLVYLSNLKHEFNHSVNLLINDDDSVIYDYIYNYIDDDYFVSLYNNLVNEKVINVIKSSRNYLNFKESEINAYIDSVYNYVSFLERNKNSYIVVDEFIRFNDGDLEKEYLRLIGKVKESKV